MIKIKANQQIYTKSKSILKIIFLLALPILISNLLKSVNNAVDMIVFSKLSGLISQEIIQDSIVATTIHFPVYNAFIAIGQAVGVAAMAIISQYLGMKKTDLARKFAAKLFLIMIIIGLFTTSISLLSSPGIVTFLGTRGAGNRIARSYFLIRSFEYLPLFVFLFYQFTRQAEGRTIEPVVVNCVGIVVNTGFTYLFVIGLKLGAFGAGLGTLLGEIVVFIIVLGLLFIPQKQKITIKFCQMFTVSLKDLKMILKFAIPAFISYISTSMCFVIIQKVTLGFGKNTSNGFAGANRISGFISNSVSSFSTVLAPFVGNNVGAGQKERAKEAYYKVILFSIFLSSVLGLMFLLLGSQIATLLLGDVYNGEVADKLNEFLIWFILSQIQMSFIWASQGLYNGSGNSKFSFLQSFIRLWLVRIPLILIGKYAFGWGWQAVWFAMMISNSVVIISDLYFTSKLSLTPKVNK